MQYCRRKKEWIWRNHAIACKNGMLQPNGTVDDDYIGGIEQNGGP